MMKKAIRPAIFKWRQTEPALILGVGALIQRGGRAVAGMLTIATAGGS